MLLGLALMVGGCVPFGIAINNAFSTNEVLNDTITVNTNYQTSIIKVDPQHYIMATLKIHLTTNEIIRNSDSQSNEYSAKYRFPIKLVISNSNGKKLYQYNDNIEWNKGTKSYDLNNVNSRQAEVIVEIDLDKVNVDPPGDIKVSVLLSEDSYYYAKILSAKLLVYDNVHKHTSTILTGVSIIVFGVIVFIIGLVMLILKQTEQSSNPSNAVTKTMNQDNNENQNKNLNTISNRSSINTAAMLCHLSTFAGLIVPFGGILGPLITWQIKKDEDPFINRHGIAALNFHLSMAIYYFVSFLLAFVVIGFFFLMILAVADLILTILASIKASNGEEYSYPLTINFIKVTES